MQGISETKKCNFYNFAHFSIWIAAEALILDAKLLLKPVASDLIMSMNFNCEDGQEMSNM